MGFRFFRRVSLGKGVRLNLSKSGPSLSFGGKGFWYTIGPGGRRTTVGLPGTGLYYTTVSRGKRFPGRKSQGPHAQPVKGFSQEVHQESVKERLTLGFFQRLVTPEDEKEFVEGCKALVDGDYERALEWLGKSETVTDAHFMGGVCALKLKRLDVAEELLLKALDKANSLGKTFKKYRISGEVAIPVTEELTSHLLPDEGGVRLLLAELYQERKDFNRAIEVLKPLLASAPDDPVVKLSLAELYEETGQHQETVELLSSTGNENFLETACLLYRARALDQLGLRSAALDTYTRALRRKKDRPAELIKTLRYERALLYEKMGKRNRYRQELERLYAEDPEWEDVRARLGLA